MEKQTPEQVMRQAFESLAKTRELMKEARKEYLSRNSTDRADSINAMNVDAAIEHLSEAYDCISEIWENDLN